MKNYNIVVYGSLCELQTFIIDGQNADKEDFVNQYDHDMCNAEEYGCGNMQADVIPATQSILDKYGITLDEYNEIAYELSKVLSFGRCGWCI